MKSGFLHELKMRGLLHDVMPETDDILDKGPCRGYIGFDPTADSLHVGSLLQILTLVRFARCGHSPIALIGGATAMVGDPSGKSKERTLLSREEILGHQEKIRQQLSTIFSHYGVEVEIVNNYDWLKDFSFLDFIREVGKHITVNYMMAKDSVKNRLEQGMSFTEFSYQLLQAYDFLRLYEDKGCILQMGGSDQWGNITTGTELIRRKSGGQAYALTTPLVKKADGTKFGKTESGNIWLDAARTSPYRFYQFWINTSDEDSYHYIRYFSMRNMEEIAELENRHRQHPEQRVLQQALAEELTGYIHSPDEVNKARKASEILFRGTQHDFDTLEEQLILEVMDGVPRTALNRDLMARGIPLLDLLTEHTRFLPSRSEAKKLIQSGGFSLNRNRIQSPEIKIDTSCLLKNRYLILQKGKKNYFLCIVD